MGIRTLLEYINAYIDTFTRTTIYIFKIIIKEYDDKQIDLLKIHLNEKNKMKDKIDDILDDRLFNIILKPYIVKIDDILANIKEESDIIEIKKLIAECLKTLIKDYIYISTINNKKIKDKSILERINKILHEHKQETKFIIQKINKYILKKSKSPEIKEKYTKEECKKWKLNKLKNPKTNRKIEEGKGIYKDLLKYCYNIRTPSPIIEEKSKDKILNYINAYIENFTRNTMYIFKIIIKEYDDKQIDLLKIHLNEKNIMKDKIDDILDDRLDQIILKPYIAKIDDILENIKEESDIIEIKKLIEECLKTLINHYIYVSTINNKKIKDKSILERINKILHEHKEDTNLIIQDINNYIKKSKSPEIKEKYTKEECKEWKLNKLKNPKTNRKIEEGKGIYKDLLKYCSNIKTHSPIDDKHKPKSPIVKGKEKYTKEECKEWKLNKLKNPKTNRKIEEGKGIYKDLLKHCSSIKTP